MTDIVYIVNTFTIPKGNRRAANKITEIAWSHKRLERDLGELTGTMTSEHLVKVLTKLKSLGAEFYNDNWNKSPPVIEQEGQSHENTQAINSR
jgi:hypothetical protein